LLNSIHNAGIVGMKIERGYFVDKEKKPDFLRLYKVFYKTKLPASLLCLFVAKPS
jgi:hypothetical protein